MALSKGMRHMNDLPDEWFTQILDLVPIREIFVLMRVSKRWAAACRFIVRTRQSLSIGNDNWFEANASKMRGWDWHRNRPTEPLDVIPANQSLESEMMKSLNEMENITRLCVYCLSFEYIRPFVRKFADQLTLLEVDIAISAGSVVFPHLTHLKCSHFAETAGTFPKLTDLVIHDRHERVKQPDMRLPSLKRLITIFINDEQIEEFILANAANLESLSVHDFRFDRAVVFLNLTEMSCECIDGNMIRALPAIRRLSAKQSVTSDILKGLPAARMLSLDILLFLGFTGFALHEYDKKGELVACAAAISGMRYLKELSICLHLKPLTEERMDESQILSSMVNKLHQLEKVSIIVQGSFAYGNGDNIMLSLVQQNPNLRDVRFGGFNFTSAAYASLAQLQHLSHFTLHCVKSLFSRNATTTDDVLTLLRGSSRKVIRKLTFWDTDVDFYQVTREIELMAQERGTTFERRFASYFCEFIIHA